MEIRRLEPTDDRSRFQSGDPDLDRFFILFAGQNQFRHHLGVTYVAAESGYIAGFVTVAPGHLEIDDLPVSVLKGLARYPLPVLRLARLGVDKKSQGAGLGKILLRFVLEITVKMAEEYGCVGVIVDAKPGAEGFYKGMAFMPFESQEGAAEVRPKLTAMILPLDDIKRGLRSNPGKS